MEITTDSVNIYEDCDIIQFSRMHIDVPTAQNKAKRNHVHQYSELYFLIDGEVDFSIEDEVKHMTSGELALISGGKYHNALRVAPQKYDHCFIYFSENSFPDYMPGIVSPGTALAELCPSGGCFMRPSSNVWNRICELIERISQMKSYDCTSGERIEKYALTLELFAIVTAELSKLGKVDMSELIGEVPIDVATANPIILEALRFIQLNFRTLDGIEEVADKCSISHSYLTRLFREQTGITPKDYLRKCRIAYAKLLLISGYDVTTVCYSSGFKNYSHFIKIFRDSEGITPLAYQRSRGCSRSELNSPD